jgi:type I restriction enzyme S subunit
LSDFAERVTRKNSNNETDLPLTISSKDGLVDQISYFNKTVASKDMSGYYLLRNGEYAYNKSYSVGYDFGSIKRLDRYPMGALSTLYICFALKKHNTDFIKVYFDSLKWYKEIYMISAEGARNHGLLNVPTDEFFATKHYLPENTTEQRKIADFLIALDRRIDAQQSLVDNLKKYKRGLLRTVFSEKGNHSLVHDAVSHRIDEVCDVLSGKRIPKGETFSTHSTEYRYITVSDMGEKYVCSGTLQYITSHTEKQIARYKVRNGDIIISVAGTLGKLNIITPDLDGVNLTENCDRFTNFRGINPEYLYHVLSADLIQSQIEASKTKNGQPKLALERIRNFTVPVPHQVRQEQFVRVMNSIDKYIALQQAILERYCKVRAGLLQQLFI